MSSRTEISVDTQRRLLKDVTDIMRNPLTSEGITYIHDEDNMLRGYAMIVGPPDSPYEHGFFFFAFHFPYNYPYSPPVVKFMTNDGIMRFHPNLYRNSKVCLSILNTWEGEPWTSTMTIHTILLTLRSLMDWKALTMEPGIVSTDPRIPHYDKCIKYKTLEIAIMGMFGDYTPKPHHVWESFFPIMKKYICEHKDEIEQKINSLRVELVNGEPYMNKPHGNVLLPFYEANMMYSYPKLKKTWRALIQSME